jgi:exonuclease SbcC
MLLHALRLKNIRSYTDETVAFPEGIVLLAGDIGAGKSTILLAIEFALFGLLRGDLSGAALLRNGSREGSVELTFALNNKVYTIGRTLRRSKTGVEQDAGHLVEDGLRRELTAIELKAAVLNLLGYPQDLITKSKSLMYRYTVYTPQEDMKKIILEDKESRLAILRKVFDIDKYQRIADNASAYAKELRRRKGVYEGQLADEPAKKQQLQDKHHQSTTVQHALLDIQPRLQGARQAVAEQKSALEKIELERSALAQQRAQAEAADRELQTLARQKQQAQQELAQLAALLAQTVTAPATPAETLAQALRQKQAALQQADTAVRTHLAARAELHAKKQLSESAIQKVAALDQCPTCLQSVDADHKHAFTQREQQAVLQLAAQLATAESSVKLHEQDAQRIRQELLQVQQQQASLREQQLTFQQYQLNAQRKQQAASALQGATALDTRVAAEKGKLELLQQQEQHAVVEHATLIERAKLLRETIHILEKDLASKQDARAKLDKLNALHHWVGEHFAGMMSVMEKQVMTKVYHEFNALFQQWFGLLIEDSVLVARLDAEFSPVMQQNGYDTEVGNLSGGEKTACALAYRLALNKVITALHSSVHTKDILILDEPTDGFSGEQIDKLRDVLDQLRARQIILVSHEPKIESLADHVLKVVKQEHESAIAV